MKNENLAIKVKSLRNRKGFSQEQLSEESKLSIRTIQRIEKGESIPRGDTLIKLTTALEVTPDDLLEWAEKEDKGYLNLLNLSALSGLLFHPLLGIVIPLIMWILKKDKIKFVNNYGKGIISFQVTWTLVIYFVMLIATKGIYINFNFNFFDVLRSLFLFEINKPFLPSLIITGVLYLYNFILILNNVGRIKKEKSSWYFPSLPFLK